MIGYAVSTSLGTALTLQALRMAIVRRRPGPGTIHHSDQGCSVLQVGYVEGLESHGFEISMTHTGNLYEDAAIESFFKTLKDDGVYLWE